MWNQNYTSEYNTTVYIPLAKLHTKAFLVVLHTHRVASIEVMKEFLKCTTYMRQDVGVMYQRVFPGIGGTILGINKYSTYIIHGIFNMHHTASIHSAPLFGVD